MGKSMDGPDMTDIIVMMRTLEAVHNAHVELTCSPDGIGSSGSGLVTVAARFDLLPGSCLPPAVAVVSKWPNSHGRTFCGHLYNELWQLDWAISQAYNQLPLAPA